jgi:CRP-like cAMP-binding protein
MADVAPRPTRARTPQRIQLLQAVPELTEHLGSEVSGSAREQLEAPVVAVPRGSWSPEELGGGTGHAFGAVLVSGLVARRIDVGGHPGLDLYGPGDLIPVDGLRRANLPAAETWTATTPSVVAVLDDHFLLGARRWPRLVSAILVKAQAQHDRLLVQLVAGQQPRVEDRLLLLLRHLSDRFGRMTPDGIVLPLQLTHEALGQLVGARRPTVTLALKVLCDRGALARLPGRSWLVRA